MFAEAEDDFIDKKTGEKQGKVDKKSKEDKVDKMGYDFIVEEYL